MSLIPAWAPNLHPLVVHFPIALLFAAGAADLAGLVLRHRKPLRDTATWLYIAGAVAAVAAYFTGDEAAEAMVLSAEVAALVDTHGDWAFGATWLFAFFASLRLAMSYLLRPRRALRIGAFVVALAGLGALAQTALHGSRLVFGQGLGVRAVTATREAGGATDTGSGAGGATRERQRALPPAASPRARRVRTTSMGQPT